MYDKMTLLAHEHQHGAHDTNFRNTGLSKTKKGKKYVATRDIAQPH